MKLPSRASALPLPVVLSLALAACSTSTVVSPPTQPVPEHACPVTVGVVSLSEGVVGAMGADAEAGFDQWLHEVQERGGVEGHPVSVVSRTVASPSQAAGAARELVDQGVTIVVTPVSSDASVAAGKVAVGAGVPAISWAGTSPVIVESVGRGMFSNGHSDRAQGDALARYARQQAYDTALTLRGPDTLFTDGLPRYFSEAFTAAGGQVVGEETYRAGDTDFSTVISRLRKGDAEVLVTAAYGPELLALLRQLRSAGVTLPVIGADGASDEAVTALPEAEGFAYTSYVVADPGRAAEVQAQVTRRSGKPEYPMLSLLGYETGLVLEDAISRSASCDPADMMKAMAATEAITGITGTIAFAGGDGMAIRDMHVVRVADGKLVTAM